MELAQQYTHACERANQCGTGIAGSAYEKQRQNVLRAGLKYIVLTAKTAPDQALELLGLVIATGLPGSSHHFDYRHELELLADKWAPELTQKHWIDAGEPGIWWLERADEVVRDGLGSKDS